METSHDGNVLVEPHLEDIQKIKGVDEFMKSIIGYVDPARHLDAPERVGHMYLAFLLSLSYAKLVVDLDRCPPLLISADSQQFKASAKVVECSVSRRLTLDARPRTDHA